jgi:hypothetical protein
VEIVEGLAGADAPLDTPLMPGGFLTDRLGFGHVVFATPAFDESHRFLTEGLGFTQSDWLKMEIAEGIELTVRFTATGGTTPSRWPRHRSSCHSRSPT